MNPNDLTLQQLAALAKLPPSRINTDAAAVYLDVSKRTLEEWRRAGRGPQFIKIGKKIVRYEIAELDKFVAEGQRRSTSDKSDLLASPERLPREGQF
jgi:Helix-turn-helix domain